MPSENGMNRFSDLIPRMGSRPVIATHEILSIPDHFPGALPDLAENLMFVTGGYWLPHTAPLFPFGSCACLSRKLGSARTHRDGAGVYRMYVLDLIIFSLLMVTGRRDLMVSTSHDGGPSLLLLCSVCCPYDSPCMFRGWRGLENSSELPSTLCQHQEGILNIERSSGLFRFLSTLNVKKKN